MSKDSLTSQNLTPEAKSSIIKYSGRFEIHVSDMPDPTKFSELVQEFIDAVQIGLKGTVGKHFINLYDESQNKK